MSITSLFLNSFDPLLLENAIRGTLFLHTCHFHENLSINFTNLSFRPAVPQCQRYHLQSSDNPKNEILSALQFIQETTRER